MNFKAAVCHFCNREIQIPTDVAVPSCPYCGHEFKQEVAAPLATLSTLLGLARTALAAQNLEEALVYFNRVLESDPNNSEAWMGKGKASGWQSSLANMRVPEMLVAFNHSIANAPEAEKLGIIQEAVTEVNRLIATLYGIARNHMQEYVSLNTSWPQYLVQISSLLSYLDEVSIWMPNDRVTLENIVELCKSCIEGVSYRDQFDQNLPKAWTITPEYEALMRSRLQQASSRLQKIDPNYVQPAIEKKQAENCFVVTATMGDIHHPTVTLMRCFRDQWLCQRRWGSSFVAWYYRNGPIAAAIIKKNTILRSAAFVFVVTPAACLARLLLGSDLDRGNRSRNNHHFPYTLRK